VQTGCELKVLKRRIYPFGHWKDPDRRGLGNVTNIHPGGMDIMIKSNIYAIPGRVALGRPGYIPMDISNTKTHFTKGSFFASQIFFPKQKGVFFKK